VGFLPPIVSIQRDEVEALEALVRWEHPERGLVAPETSFRCGADKAIVEIGRWCSQRPAGRPHGSRSEPTDVSARQFADRDLVDVMAAAIRDAGLHPSRLALEVTESLFLDDSESQRRTLVALEELGVSISLDDFGTGYSSLSYLTRFPIGTLKVDRSFISKLDDDREEEAIVAMARALNLRVVAEGVEQEGLFRPPCRGHPGAPSRAVAEANRSRRGSGGRARARRRAQADRLSPTIPG